MKLTSDQKRALEKTAKEAGVSYIRLFGSAIRSLKKARDIDIVVGHSKKLTLSQYSILSSGVEKVFHKPIDIVELRSGLSPLLIFEIGKTSIPLFENPKKGLEDYINKIEPLLGIANDEILSFPKKLRDQSFKLMQAQSKLRPPHVS